MSLDDFTPDLDSSEGWWNSAESNKEQSEKFQEKAKKAWAWIQRTRKDEKKAKKWDMLLANFLVKIILNKKFDDLLDPLFKAIDLWYPSNFLLWILSLVYIDISNKIRESNWIEKIEFNYDSKEKVKFDDHAIDSRIKNRINFWVEDIILSVSVEYSNVLTKRLIKLIEIRDDTIINFVSYVFIFFLKEINVTIENKEAANISNFIISEVLKKIKKLDLENI